MINKYPFLKDYKVRPLSNNSFINKIVIIFIISLVLLFFSSGIFKFVLWIIILASLFTISSNFYLRLKSKWSRIHYPVWVDYYGALGYLASIKKAPPTQADIEKAFLVLLNKLFNHVDELSLSNLLKDILDERIKFADKTFLKKIFKNRANLKGKELDTLVSISRDIIINPKDGGTNNRINITLIIGTLIEANYGLSEKEEYFYNVLMEKAK